MASFIDAPRGVWGRADLPVLPIILSGYHAHVVRRMEAIKAAGTHSAE